MPPPSALRRTIEGSDANGKPHGRRRRRAAWLLAGVGALAAACAPARPGDERPRLTAMTPDCDTARRAIETRRFDGGWAALAADLGAPDARRDFVHGTTAMAGGEQIHAARGITVFVNPDNQVVVHVAVYAPTTVDDYLAHLRPSLAKPRAPAR